MINEIIFALLKHMVLIPLPVCESELAEPVHVELKSHKV